MSNVTVIRCTSVAQFVFSVDQPRCGVVWDGEKREVFEKRFGLLGLQVLEGNGMYMWQYPKGLCKLGEQRKLQLGFVQGNENEIGVHVEGTTEDAIDALREIWFAIGEIAEEKEVALDESLGTFAYSTTAVVQLSRTYRELFPGLELIARHTREGLGASLMGAPGVEQFRIESHVRSAVGALAVDRATIIEPRFTSKAEDRIFFTQSPLRSDLHKAMLEDLCRSVK